MMLANKAMQPAGPKRPAADSQIRWVHAMAYSRYIGFERAVILLFATVACALLTMTVGIVVFLL